MVYIYPLERMKRMAYIIINPLERIIILPNITAL
jgi:hypothetical protein